MYRSTPWSGTLFAEFNEGAVTAVPAGDTRRALRWQQPPRDGVEYLPGDSDGGPHSDDHPRCL